MINNCFNNTITNSFGNNLLCFFKWIQVEFLLNVFHWNFRITNVKLFKAELQYCVSKTEDKWVIFVVDENLLVFLYNLIESSHVSWFNAVDNLEIWWKWLLEERLWENLSVWNISHEQLNNYLKLLDLNSECLCSNFWTLSQGLDKSSLGFGVLKLNCLDSSQVVQVPRILVIGNILWEGSFYDELSGLFIQILRQIWP